MPTCWLHFRARYIVIESTYWVSDLKKKKRVQRAVHHSPLQPTWRSLKQYHRPAIERQSFYRSCSVFIWSPPAKSLWTQLAATTAIRHSEQSTKKTRSQFLPTRIYSRTIFVSVKWKNFCKQRPRYASQCKHECLRASAARVSRAGRILHASYQVDIAA